LNVLASLLQRRAGVSAASALVVEAALLLAALVVPRLRSLGPGGTRQA
jgi:hypothetical protein